MPMVTNTRAAAVGLQRFASEPGKGKRWSSNSIEKVEIGPGQTAEVDESFLSSEGAKSLIADGFLLVGDQAAPAEPEADATDEPKGRKGKGGGK